MAKRHWLIAVGITCVTTVFVTTASAQVLTGSLFGRVKDSSGAIMPGVSVTATSGALIAGSATTIAGPDGTFHFPALPPGDYAVAVEARGFATYREEGIRIGVEAAVERTVILQVAGIAEAISVEEGTTLDARRTGVSIEFDRGQIEAIPVRRFSMFDFIKAAPGVSATSASSGLDPTVSVFGSGVNENLYLLDGTNFTCPCSGGPQPQPDIDVIQAVHIDSVGPAAEFGNIQGGVFNVVTKAGSDRFEPDLSYYGQTQQLTSQPVELPCPRCSVAESGYRRVEYRDLTTHLGGPIVAGHAWFFAGYQYLRDADSQPGTDPTFPRTSEYDKVFGKATWQVSPRVRLMSSVHDEFWVTPQRPTLVQPFETTVRTSGTRPTATFGQVTAILSNKTLLDARVSRFVAPQTSDPSTGDRLTPNRVDLATGVQSGGPQGFGALTLMRTTAAAALTHDRRWLGVDHEMKSGVQIETGEHVSWTAFQGGVVSYTDNARQPVQATFRQPTTTGGAFLDAGLFVMDTVRVTDRFTADLGVRVDRDRASSPDLPAHDADGHETGEIIHGRGTLYTWNVLSPRLGFTAKLTRDGKTMVRGSYGRFHQGILTGELAPFHPGLTPVTTAAFDAATGGYTRVISVVDPTVNVRLDAATKSPYTDQTAIGVERELGRRVSMSASVVHKDGRDFIGWTDTGGIYQPDTRVLPDGQAIPVLVLTNGTSARRFLLTNPPGYFLRYNGGVFMVDKRWAGGRQALASYTYSKSTGLQPSSGAPAGSGQFSSTLGSNPFGRDPNTLTNATGALPNDRTHMFRVMGSSAVPKIGLLVAANVQYLSGLPWSASAQVPLPQGLTRILLETPGARHLSSQTLVDLRASRGVDVGRARIEVLLDVLNALDSTAEERVADDNLFSQNFGRPSVFVDPRRAMLGARLTFGR